MIFAGCERMLRMPRLAPAITRRDPPA